MFKQAKIIVLLAFVIFFWMISSVDIAAEKPQLYSAGMEMQTIEVEVAPDVKAKVDELESKAIKELNHSAWLSSISNNSVAMYNMRSGIDGLLSLYEATSNTKYVEYAVEYAKKYRSKGEDVNSDGYLDWYSSWLEKASKGKQKYSHWHVEWRAAAGIAAIVALTVNDPNLKSYEDDARVLTSFLEQHVWKKWTGGYSDSANTSEHNETIGRFGVIALRLYQATGKSEYLEYVKRRGDELRNSLKLNSKGAYYWPGYTNGGEEDVYDTSHSGDIVDFMVEAYRAGLVFDKTDIQRLANTVKKNLWNGSLSTPQFQDYVDGGDHTSKWSKGGYGQPGRNQVGWVKLAQFDKELQEIYYNWVNTDNVYSYDRIKVGVYGELARALYLSLGAMGKNPPYPWKNKRE